MLVWQLGRIVAVIALVCVAAVIATPKGRVPLALRGLSRILGWSRAATAGEQVPPGRKAIALLLVLLAAALAMV